MEYERTRAIQQDDATVAFREFVTGLQMMSADFDRMVENFAWCAGQIAGVPDAPSQIRGMMEFAARYHEFGLERTLQTVQENSGVPVNITIPQSSSRERPGIVVGIVGARYINRRKFFDGVAVTENSRGQQAFVAVRINPNGKIFLLLEDQQPKDPETMRLMRDLDR